MRSASASANANANARYHTRRDRRYRGYSIISPIIFFGGETEWNGMAHTLPWLNAININMVVLAGKSGYRDWPLVVLPSNFEHKNTCRWHDYGLGEGLACLLLQYNNNFPRSGSIYFVGPFDSFSLLAPDTTALK
ncbi:hypothetical protein VNO77_11475 [Canavalia gladiata]|uniref:Uncharacterized protein n=1 Tax=Canavalia gladiata TaxID=3824 RepID=A0AAN9MBZ1_CANGL